MGAVCILESTGGVSQLARATNLVSLGGDERGEVASVGDCCVAALWDVGYWDAVVA